MPTEVAPCYFLISIATPAPLLRHRFFGSSHHSPCWCRSLGGVSKLWMHAFFVLVQGGERITMEMHDGEIQIDPLGWERMKEGEWQVAGATCIWFPTCFLNFLLCKPQPTYFMKNVCCSDIPLPREASSPYSIGKVDVSFCKFIASATDSGKLLPNDDKLHIINMLSR